MKAATCTLFLFAVSCRAIADEGRSNPLGTVLELMSALEAKITKEGEAEAKAFKDFFEWCDDASKNINNEITTGKAQQAKLEAKIGQLTSAIDTSDTNIESLAGSISSAESELKEATAIRTTEAADFAASEKELVDTVDTLDRAISILSTEMAKNPAAFAQIDTSSMANLVQSLSVVVDAAGFSTSDRQKLVALVQSKQGDEDNEVGAPAAAVYKSHSSGIIDTLEDLKEKAESELADARKAETSAKHNYGMMKQSLDDQMAADTKDLNEEKAAKAASEEAKATAEGDLSTTISDLKNSENALSTANSDCMTTAADHEATVAARTEELKVIATAKKILQGTTSGAVEQTYSFLQIASSSKATSTLHTRADLANSEVVNLVKKLARQHHSAALAQLASRISSAMRFASAQNADPFAKVKGLITDMISRLEEDAKTDASHKAYCDKETGEASAKKVEKKALIEKLSTEIDSMSARSAKLKEEVASLQKELAELASSQAEMDKIRSDEKALYTKNSAEMKTGIEGVQKALSILKDYYASEEKSHSAAEGAGSGIIGMLEVIESDFTKGLAEMEVAESSAEKDYEKVTKQNEIATTMKNQDVKYKQKEAAGLDKSASQTSSDLESAQAELDAIMEYLGKLADMCVAKAEPYAERKRRRDAEIEGLKQALNILDGEAVLMQQTTKHTLRGSQ
mmetsp:Transcript_60389/g.93943  ORF Transcript_60389/g.93943 Transcript_60389/m.93943 type:complete len:687 (-) Transcript_60389:39-2099(-)